MGDENTWMWYDMKCRSKQIRSVKFLFWTYFHSVIYPYKLENPSWKHISEKSVLGPNPGLQLCAIWLLKINQIKYQGDSGGAGGKNNFLNFSWHKHITWHKNTWERNIIKADDQQYYSYIPWHQHEVYLPNHKITFSIKKRKRTSKIVMNDW